METDLDEEDVRAILREQCAEAGSISAWAKRKGIAFSYVAEVRRGMREPGPSILAALGIEKVVGYRKKELR